MIYFLIVLALTAGLICVILFSKTKVIIEYRNKNLKLIFQNFMFKASIDSKRLARLGEKHKKNGSVKDEFSTEVPHSQECEKTPQGFLNKIENLKSRYRAYKDIFDMFLRCMRYRITFSDIFIGVTYGTGDAAYTGMLYGAIWALIGDLYAFMRRYFYIDFPDLELRPEFDKKVFEIEAEGIIAVRFVHIIIAALRSLVVYRKHKKQKSNRDYAAEKA